MRSCVPDAGFFARRDSPLASLNIPGLAEARRRRLSTSPGQDARARCWSRSCSAAPPTASTSSRPSPRSATTSCGRASRCKCRAAARQRLDRSRRQVRVPSGSPAVESHCGTRASWPSCMPPVHRTPRAHTSTRRRIWSRVPRGRRRGRLAQSRTRPRQSEHLAAARRGGRNDAPADAAWRPGRRPSTTWRSSRSAAARPQCWSGCTRAPRPAAEGPGGGQCSSGQTD